MIQETLVREALRVVERRFTGWSLAGSQLQFGDGRALVTCPRLEVRNLGGAEGRWSADVAADLDVHYGLGTHVKTRATVQVTLTAEAALARVGGRQVALVTIGCARAPDASEVTFGPHPDDDTLFGPTTARALFPLWREVARERLERGYSFFWESGRGAALLLSARRPDGEAYRPEDVDAPDVAAELARPPGALFPPFELAVLGAGLVKGDCVYRYRFAAGVHPFVGLDTSLLGGVRQLLSGAEADRSVRVRLDATVTSGQVDLALTGDGQAPEAWTTVTPSAPGALERAGTVGMLTLHLLNRCTGLIEGEVPRVRVAATEVPAGP